MGVKFYLNGNIEYDGSFKDGNYVIFKFKLIDNQNKKCKDSPIFRKEFLNILAKWYFVKFLN